MKTKIKLIKFTLPVTCTFEDHYDKKTHKMVCCGKKAVTSVGRNTLCLEHTRYFLSMNKASPTVIKDDEVDRILFRKELDKFERSE